MDRGLFSNDPVCVCVCVSVSLSVHFTYHLILKIARFRYMDELSQVLFSLLKYACSQRFNL